MGCTGSKRPRHASDDGEESVIVDTELLCLLPAGQMPECALLWVERRQSKGEAELAQRRAAAEWALDALCHAHEDKRLKKAVRKLLAVRYFAVNLEADGMLFSNVLRPGLRARLVELGAPLADLFSNVSLAGHLSDEKVAAAVGRPQDHTLAAARRRTGKGGRPTKIDVLPSVLPFVDYDKPETFPDEVYAHAVLMVAAALDASFQARVGGAVGEHNAAWRRGRKRKAGTAAHVAPPPKAYARVMTKVRSDYKHDARPRAQHNVDVVRCLVTADTPEELLALSGRLVKQTFGGVVRAKNLFSAPEAERAERFHLLPLMLTVEIGAEGGATYGEFVQRPEVKSAFNTYVAARDVTVPPHRWRETTDRARALLESNDLASLPVRLLGELQMVLTAHAKVRHAMHEVYKAYRAESALLLWEDYARTAVVEEGEDSALVDALAIEPPTLWSAAVRGNRPAVEAFAAQAPKAIDDRHKSGTTPLYEAAQRGFTDVAKALADCRADVDRAKTATGATPLYAASENGHADVVHVLLEAHADADRPTTDDGTSPLFVAAQNGHADIARLLLGASASADQAKSDTGSTPLFVAAQGGHLDAVCVLLDAGADKGTARPSDGATPLFIAAQGGHTGVLRALADAGADLRAADARGLTPLFAAEKWGTPEAAEFLRAALEADDEPVGQ